LIVIEIMKKIPDYIHYIINNIFFLFLFTFLLRCVFYFFGVDLQDASSEEIKKAFLLGIRFDIKLAIISFFPLALLILIVNHRFFKNSIYKK
jgi:hypothetical protein